MLDEEVIKRNTQNISERILIANVLVMVLLSALLGGGNSESCSGLLIAFGIVAPVNVAIFRRVWPDAPRRLYLKYVLSISPYLALLAIAIAGVCNPCVEMASWGGVSAFRLLDNYSSAAITSAADSAESALFPAFETLAIAASALSVYFICGSRYILRRILSYCVMGAALLALLGLLLELSLSLENVNNVLRMRQDGFSTFSSSSEWSVFAMIWMGAAFACALYSSSYRRLSAFVLSFRFLMLACACVLFFTALLTGTPLERIFACSIFALGAFLFAVSALPEFGDIRRKLKSGEFGAIAAKFASPAAYFALAAFAVILIFAFFDKSVSNPDEKLIVSENSPITLRQKALVFEDSMKLIRERPVFGWGSGSFPTAFAFVQGSDTGASSWSSPTSDLLKKLVEDGFAGLALALLTPLALFLRQLARFDFGLSSVVMLGTICCVLLVSIVASPFESSCVYASFWFFLAGFFTWNRSDID